MPKKRKPGRPPTYNFKNIKPGKFRLFEVENINSCRRAALIYAQNNELIYETEKVTEGLRVWNRTE